MNTQLTGLLLVLSLVLAPGGKQGKVREHFIDLLIRTPASAETRVPADKRLTLQQPIKVSSHGEKPKASVTVLAPELDRGIYTWGEAFAYFLVIENQGKQPIRFPTLTADDQVGRALPGATIATLGLRFTDEKLIGEVVGTHQLFGADSIPGSLIVVAPGEQVRIRAGGKWSLMGVFKGVVPGQGAYRVSALIQMVRAGRAELVVQSETHTDVQISK